MGGSIGMIASWFGYEPVKAFFMGISCGIFAAATRISGGALTSQGRQIGNIIMVLQISYARPMTKVRVLP